MARKTTQDDLAAQSKLTAACSAVVRDTEHARMGAVKAWLANECDETHAAMAAAYKAAAAAFENYQVNRKREKRLRKLLDR